MTTKDKSLITVEASINAPVENVWVFWTDPKHITHWNNASDDWHTPKAENDLKKGGKFNYRMEATDGSSGFDFGGVYNEVKKHQQIAYSLDDGRKVNITFTGNGKETRVTQTFEAENTHSIDMQRQGWQAILDNFKRYTESAGKYNKLHYEININAPVERVYQIMLDKKGYSEWTADFNPTSHFKGSWDKGSEIHFLGTDENGKLGGMVSRIRENIAGKFISIEHLGIIQNGIEITSGAEVEEWAGALENYTFKRNNGNTLLVIDMDANDEFKSYFEETWPKALKKLKHICEND